MVIDTLTAENRPNCRDCNWACRACKRKCFITHSSSKSAAGVSFFIVMGNKFSTTLEIPSHSAKKIISLTGCRHALLEGPNDGLWDVLLCCSSNSASFKEGWENFVSHHSIQAKDILVFRHVQDAHFVVQIFECSGKEKQRDIACRFTPAVEMATNNSTLKGGTKFVRVQNGFDSRKLSKMENCAEKNLIYLDDEEEENNHQTQKSESHQNPDVKPYPSDDSGYPNPFEKDECQFSRRLGKSAFGYSSRLYLPIPFVRRCFRGEERGKVLLVCQRRKWSVEFLVNVEPSGFINVPRLQNGWRQFVIDNQLKMNDTCHFQLIDKTNYVFKVRLSRA